MAEVMKKATRDSYGEALVELGQENPNIVVFDADLAGATKTGVFKKTFPDRFFDCGIAEGNMMVAAAGVSTCGYIPFASTFAMFAAGRAYEQIRNSIGYPHLNVKIGATHAGISVGEDGATHQCNEDIALMRTIPGMVVINPADDVEAKAAVKAAAAYVGPVYLRFGRLAAPIFNDATTYKFEMGKGITLRDGKDVTIVATGILVGEAIKAGELLAGDVQHRHEDAGENDADGVVGREQGDGDAVEAHGGQRLIGGPVELRVAGQVVQCRTGSGQRTGDGHGQHDVALILDAGVARGVAVAAAGLELIA